MPFMKFQLVLFVAFCTVTAHAHDVDAFCTNGIACANGRTVLSAMVDGKAQDRTNAQALVGSLVAFAGNGHVDMGANLTVTGYTTDVPIREDVLVDVELNPSRKLPPANGWRAVVMGTLKSVDFKKRVIYIQAKPENWICETAQ